MVKLKNEIMISPFNGPLEAKIENTFLSPIAGYLHWKLFSRTWKNSLGAEMLTEEKFAKRAKALIMIMLI